MVFDSRQLNSYPSKPGVYLMKDLEGGIVYIGKAKNLKARLKQYFLNQDTRLSVPFFIPKIDTIDFIVVSTEKEALILENILIKKHKPKYNVLLKDDKTYPSLVITTSHSWPKIQKIRFKKKENAKDRFFGPYTDSMAAREIFDLVIELFLLRQCSDREFENRVRPCILYDINRCLAPCTGKCTKKEYEAQVDQAIRFLEGKEKEILKEFYVDMKKASDAREYEKAEKILQRIRQIEHIIQKQRIEDLSAGQMCDVIGFFQKDLDLGLVLLKFREGKLVGSEYFSFFDVWVDSEEVLSSFILQHYQKEQAFPEEILVPKMSDAKDLEDVLFEKIKKRVKILAPQKGKKTALLDLAHQNARILLEKEIFQKSARVEILKELKEVLGLSKIPKRILCVDVAHLAQANPVSAVVCFVDGEQERKETKFFKVSSGGDCPALKESIFHYFSVHKKGCDLFMVDGGKAQLSAALEALKQINILPLEVLAIAKEEARHDKGLTQEKLFFAGRENPVVLSRGSPVLFFLQKIRDAAHQAAISFHRKERSLKSLGKK